VFAAFGHTRGGQGATPSEGDAPAAAARRVTAEDCYFFDLRGYLVVPGALGGDEVRRLNDAIDALPADLRGGDHGHVHRGLTRSAQGRGRPGAPTSMFDWGPPFRALVGHRALNPYLADLLGPDFRLDHQYAIFQRGGVGGPANPLHNGGTPYNPTCTYAVRDGRIYNGLLVVSLAITDVPAGAGGFCCIPGSHKSEFRLPPGLRETGVGNPVVEQPALSAGDALIFTEALTHGALPWRAAHERRALLFKYCPGHVQWHPDPVPWDGEWTDTQLRILRPPYARDRAPSTGTAASFAAFGLRRLAVGAWRRSQRRFAARRHIDHDG